MFPEARLFQTVVNSLVSVAKLVLEFFFQFEDKVFEQKLGTVIGTKFAPEFGAIRKTIFGFM